MTDRDMEAIDGMYQQYLEDMIDGEAAMTLDEYEVTLFNEPLTDEEYADILSE